MKKGGCSPLVLTLQGASETTRFMISAPVRVCHFAVQGRCEMFSCRFPLIFCVPLLVVITLFFACGFVLLDCLAQETLIPVGAVWKYSDTGTDLHSAGWPSVDDSMWAEGVSQLGYGDGDEATVISYGGNPDAKYPCYYFRHSFDVADPFAFDGLTLKVVRDDGCVVYLNGVEVARSNMPSGEITYGTWASVAVGGADESAWYEFIVDPAWLITGPNVVAVEVHQSSGTSTDVSFDLELIAEFPPPPVPDVTLVSPPDESVVNTTDVAFECAATDEIGLVDATLYIGNQPQTVTFSSPDQSDDAQISADQPNMNFGGDAAINVDGATPHAHAVIKFLGVFGDGAGQVPVGSSIASATLQINCTDPGNTMQLYRLTEDWTEDQVTWNERFSGTAWTDTGADGAGSNAGVALDAQCSSTGWQTFDITQFVQEWSSGGQNFGIVITDTGTDGIDFDSSESVNSPVLTVSYQTEWQPVEDPQSLSGTSDTATFITALNDHQDYVWNCLVTNTLGQQSWAPADYRLTVDTNAPDVPVLVQPADGAVGVSTSPMLEVTVSDPDGDVLDVTFYGRLASGTEEFILIALPDTQKYVLDENYYYDDIFTAQTYWIAGNASSRNIAFVTHEGDIVDVWNDTIQWDRANYSMSLLDNVVPYGVVPGNHDQPTDYYNVYFPYTRYEGQSWYGGHYPSTKNDSNYELFAAGGDDYMILHLDYWPGDDVIAWADSVLKAHADRKAIITTHGFIDGSGNRNVHYIGSTQYIWDGLVVPNDNVYFILCGHVAAEYTRTDVVNGREVHQLLADYQGRPYGGEGWLRIMRFVPTENKVYVETFSPWLGQYERDANSEFTLDFPMSDFSVIGSQTGVISGDNASTLWPDLALGTQYDWYVTVSDGTGRMQTGPAWQFTTTFNDIMPPVISDVEATDVTDTTAAIVWTTDEAANSLVDYGLDTAYGSQALDGNYVISHSVELTGLASDATYHYRVTSTDRSGNSSSSSDYTFITLPPNHPPMAEDQSVTTPEDTAVGITLTASDEDPDILTYSIVGGPSNGSLTGDLPNVTYTPNADYHGDDSFTFVANDGKDDSNIATVSITVSPVNDPPGVPQNLSAIAGVGTVTLEWDDNVEPEGDLNGYNIYRSETSGSYDFGAPLASVSESTYVDDDVVNGTTYYYVVKALDVGDLSSDPSAEVSATPDDTVYDAYVSQAPIVTYGELAGDGIAGTTAAGDDLVQTVTEVPNGKAGASSLQVEYILHTTANRSEVTQLVLHLVATWTELDADDPLIVSIHDGSGWEDITVAIQGVSFTPATPEPYISDGGNIRVLFTDTTPIKKEKKDTLTLDLLYADIVAGPPDTESPAAPTGLTATAGDTLVNLDWTDNTEPDLDGYYVYRSQAGGPYDLITANPLSLSEYQDTGLANGVTYHYTVSAVDVSGNESEPSADASATPVDQPPSAPTGLSATPGNGQVSLDWNDNAESDILGYNVYRSEISSRPYTLLNTAGPVVDSSFVDSAVTNGTTYYYVVTAVDASSESDPSAEVSATPEESQTIHVEDIAMSLGQAGKNWKAVATVLIHDGSDAAQPGALVVGDWYFKGSLIQTGGSATTDGSGHAVLLSPPKKAKSGDTFTFAVTDVVLTGYTYEPSDNKESQDSVTLP